MTFARKVIQFNSSLSLTIPLPSEVSVMNPFANVRTRHYSEQFYTKYYNDDDKRRMIIGINPGRNGGGVTGVPFTDPIQLKQRCEIDNELPFKPELSSDFIYRMITAYGGVVPFYKHYYISAVSPLGFTKNGKNMNYYDDRALQRNIQPHAIVWLEEQLRFGIHRDVCFCLGEGKNYKFLCELNKTNGFFEQIIPLPHPRFIMQYKRKLLQEYINVYLTTFLKASQPT